MSIDFMITGTPTPGTPTTGNELSGLLGGIYWSYHATSAVSVGESLCLKLKLSFLSFQLI